MVLIFANGVGDYSKNNILDSLGKLRIVAALLLNDLQRESNE